jgi:hypothetical protein
MMNPAFGSAVLTRAEETTATDTQGTMWHAGTRASHGHHRLSGDPGERPDQNARRQAPHSRT